MKTKDYLSLDPKNLSVSELHGHLLSAVAPRPIALASTVDREGNINLSPFSFFNVFSANPPVMIFSPARRGTDNSEKHTYQNVREVPEVVINIVNHPMVEQMSLSSTMYDKGVNEFIKSGLTPIESDKIRPPRVAESPVAFECLVENIIELGRDGGAGNLIISRVVKMHIHRQYLNDREKIDTESIDLVGRMGGAWYTRARGEALFQIPKPLASKGIGVDALPDHVKNSSVLTGNDLGRLGNLKMLPEKTLIIKVRAEVDPSRQMNEDELHRESKKLLDSGKTEKALALLVSLV